MKKTITLLLTALCALTSTAQTVADFESFSLPGNYYYKDTNGVDFQTTNAIFRYDWNKTYKYWSGGFAYTNKNDTVNKDSIYNCIAYKGYNNSNYYATGQLGAVIKLKTPHNFVNGFYITNTTYAWKSMKSGDMFAKKFGGPTGNDPDWFKVTVKGYLGGVAKPDSAEFYLADYRFSNNSLDYIVNNWNWVSCSNLGNVDSVKFFMYSSDVGSFGINTPAFFSIDNFTTSQGVGIDEVSADAGFSVFPNPAHDVLFISTADAGTIEEIRILNTVGEEVRSERWKNASGKLRKLEIGDLQDGLYMAELKTGERKQIIKFIKN